MGSGEERIFLIGYRGTGKSTVARVLAPRLEWSWVDSDDEIERRAAKSIAAMFAEDGEPAFRDLEETVIADLCQRERTVVALGGGAVLREATRRRLVESGPVVWLTASAATLTQRIASDAGTADRRPRLTDLAADDEVVRVLAEREPLYQECATLTLTTEDHSPEQIADEIARRLPSL